MAVIILKGLDRNITYLGTSYVSKFIAAYNSNVIRWKTSTVKTVSRGEIWFNGTLKFIDLIPINGELEFDCYEPIKTIFNYFDDTISYNVDDIVKYDDNLFKKINIKLRLIYADTTTDETNITGYFTRAVRQHTDVYKTSMFLYEPLRIFNIDPPTVPTSALSLMRTGEKENSFSQRLKIFKGYPLDISVIAEYSNDKMYFGVNQYDGITLSYLIKNITTSPTDKLDKYVERIIISDGQSMHDVFSSIPNFTKGQLNIISLKDFGTKDSQYTFTIDVVDECGVYLKWLNGSGGWSYWLFNKNTRNLINVKPKGVLNKNSGGLSFSADEINIGQDAEEKIQLVTNGLEYWYWLQLIDIATSPCVYMYMKPKGSLAYENDNVDVWLKLPTISNFKYTAKKETNLYSIGFELELPKIFTQTL